MLRRAPTTNGVRVPDFYAPCVLEQFVRHLTIVRPAGRHVEYVSITRWGSASNGGGGGGGGGGAPKKGCTRT